MKVSNYAVLLARALKLPKKDIENLRLAAILHDIGKLGIKEKILLKPSSLDNKEYAEVKKHSEIGADIVKPLKFFNDIISIIKYHHENYDGTGYPEGLKGKEIPLPAQILALADSYDALTSHRAYRKAYSHKEAVRIMKQQSGKKFNHRFLDTFIASLTSREKGKIK